ncbi:universal stress protein [Streptomyces pseudovenezuelae]|uniref:universal stress protein n=1 Tax=Streptomyces pseudovenezuelae TaxID=67350 RepID=UPI002E3288C2|nr:universal stress protein [Streptomyces pseudovenezuelae]
MGVADDVDAGAALFAFEEVRRRGGEVRALHVSAVPEQASGLRLSPTERKTLADSEAAVPRMTVAAAREKFPDVGVGVRVDTLWTGGAGALVEASRAADLAVITARHRHGLGLGPHTGSFTHALLHRAHCPVVFVPVG